MKELNEYLETFVFGKDVARTILLNEMKIDVVEGKMRSLRSQSVYEKGAREYYNQYGTSGEF